MVRIIADSTCDLSPELVARYGVKILPLEVILGSRSYEDGVTITPDEIYAWADANRTTPKTSAPSEANAEALMKPILAAGDDIVCFVISESMSASGNVCRLAAKKCHAEDRVHVVDSKNLSTGIGHLVLEAAILAAQGADADRILRHVETLIPRVRASFVVDTLTYLHRGGRCSGVAALAGGILRLHPQINVVDGKMIPGKKYRGRYDKIILEYAKDLESELLRAEPERVFITHAGCDREIVDAVRSYLEGLNHFNEILETRAGGVVSSHCGYGTLGVLYIAGKNQDAY